MFGRRRRAPSNPAVNNVVNANPSAATAAAQAFLGTRPSNSSLSSAAAAAALRSRPMTPTSVADVQTKRTVRRTNSTSSAGSSIQGRPTSQLERRGSQGSMTERTFREPSPNRGPGRPSVDDAPPVPAIPKNIPSSPVSTSPKPRRTASLEPPALRVASPLSNSGGRGSSLGPSATPPAPKRSGARTSISSAQELTGLERPASRGSVNFSLPTNMRPMSSCAQRQLTSPTPQSPNQKTDAQPEDELIYDPNTRSFRSKAELMFVEQRIRDASQPEKRKKKAVPHNASGSHLAEGSVGGRIKGTAVDTVQLSRPVSQQVAPQSFQPQTNQNTQEISQPQELQVDPVATTSTPTPAPKKKKKKKKKKVVVNDVGPDEGIPVGGAEMASDGAESQGQYNTRAGMLLSGTLLSKKPSIVREDREREEAEDDSRRLSMQSTIFTAVEGTTIEERATSPEIAPVVGRGHGSPPPVSHPQSRKETRSISQPVHSSNAAEAVTTDGAGETTLERKGSVRDARVQSVSPVRNAHFLPKPESTVGLVVKHDPPARSISPRKSALKHSPSPRGLSPATTSEGSDQGSHQHSEVPGMSTALGEEPTVARKKSVRVSFDDGRNVVLGQSDTQSPADSPLVQSPQNSKRGWFGMGRGKKRDTDVADEGEHEVMTPRPMLPTFGSVREKKSREIEERPLVKPHTTAEPAEPARTPTPPPIQPGSATETAAPMGQSLDHAIGAVISQDIALKNEANISRSREPLPPQVTSVEGSGYISDDSSTHTVEVPEKVVEAIESQENAPPSDTLVEEKQESPVDLKPEVVDALQTAETQQALLMSQNHDTHVNNELPAAKTNGNGNIPEGAIPVVAITRATPTREDLESGGECPMVPGAFPSASSESDVDDGIVTVVQVVEHHSTELSPAAVGIAEPEPVEYPVGAPPVGEIASEIGQQRHSTIYEESEDESIYSDAAEDLSDMQGDGFMSLDAVVESPIVATFPHPFQNTPPESPTTKVPAEYKKSSLAKQTSQPNLEEGWDKAQQYWSGLTAEKKRELEMAARGEADEADEEEDEETETEGDSSDTEVPGPEPMPTPKKQAPEQRPQNQPPAPSLAAPPRKRNSEKPYNNNRTYQIAPGSRAGPDGRPKSQPMRSSMRSPPPAVVDDGHMRKSMRNGPTTGSVRSGGSMRTSMRGSVDEPPRQRQRAPPVQERPMSYPPPGNQSVSSTSQKHARNLSTGAAASAATAARSGVQKPVPALGPTPTLRRKGSDDSVSSFRRAKPAKEGTMMRRSMRGSIQQGRQQSPEPQGARSSRFSMRSISPANSGAPPVAMRSSMRTSMRSHNRHSSNDSGTPTLRSDGIGRARSPLSLFGRSKLEASKAKSMRSSRFGDSSDEEDARPLYRSRFVDSSDEEDVAPLPAPSVRSSGLRAIPRRNGVEDGDSSDLPDSDDEKPQRTTKASAATGHQGTALASGSLRRSGSGRGTIGVTTTTVSGGLTNPSPRPQQKRRSSLMSILRRKKDPESKVHKIEAESAARRDTALERSRAEITTVAMRRQDSDFSVTSGPKLQKRHPNRRMMSGGSTTWPLHDTTEDGDAGEQARPYTSDGLGASGGLSNGARPEIGGRRVTDSGLSNVEVVGGDHTLKKKKKFSRLRRAFGLDD